MKRTSAAGSFHIEVKSGCDGWVHPCTSSGAPMPNEVYAPIPTPHIASLWGRGSDSDHIELVKDGCGAPRRKHAVCRPTLTSIHQPRSGRESVRLVSGCCTRNYVSTTPGLVSNYAHKSHAAVMVLPSLFMRAGCGGLGRAAVSWPRLPPLQRSQVQPLPRIPPSVHHMLVALTTTLPGPKDLLRLASGDHEQHTDTTLAI